MLVLHGIPINHFRPQGRQQLIAELQRLDIAFRRPSFVAVEWDHEHHRQVAAQRPAFEEMLRKEFLSASEDELQILTNSLGYEGDAHQSVWPDITTIWLDKGREADNDSISHYAQRRLEMLRAFWKAGGNGQPLGSLLDFIDQKAIARAKVRQESRDLDQREQRWITRLAKQLSTLAPGNWGIIILGGSHFHEKFLSEMSTIGYAVRGCFNPWVCL